MSFASPTVLAWTAASLVVLLLHLLRRRERVLPVSALFLWEHVQPDAASHLQRWMPRADLLLTLQLLVVLLLVTAAAQPMLHLRRPAGATAIIVDISAALAAEGRDEEARQAVNEILATSSGPWVVIGWADPPKLLVPPTDRQEQVRAGLGQLEPTLLGRPPISVALALLEDTWDRIVAITASPPDVEGVETVRLTPVENIGVRAFSVRPQPDGSAYQALVFVRNDTESYRDLQVVFRSEGEARTLLQARLLAPGEEDVIEFPLIGGLSPAFTVELRPQDAFPWDNIRYCALDVSSVLRVRWLGDEDRYVWAALQAARPARRVDEPPWDLTVAVRTTLVDPHDGPVLLLESSSPEASLGLAQPAGTLRAMDHPLVNHSDFDGVRADLVYPPALPEQAEVALWAHDVPALARWETPLGRRVLLSLGLERSNLPLEPSYPILLRNFLAWLLPFELAPSHYVGQAVPVPEGAQIEDLQNDQDVWLPQSPGLYRIEVEGQTRWIAVNVPLVPLQSRTPPATGEVPLGLQEQRRQEPIWHWAVWAALACLALEGYLACRRGV